jgi:hypothetical protein
MFSSHGKLTTQALENIQSQRSASVVRADANLSGEQVVSSLAMAAASCSDASSSLDKINTGTVTEGCPEAAATVCKKPRKK